jgi:hypothetical protein
VPSVQERYTAGTMLLRGGREERCEGLPECGCTIQKSEGGDHMNCKGLWSTYLLGVYVGFEEGEGDVWVSEGVS